MDPTNILIAGIGIVAILAIALLAWYQSPTQHIGPVVNHPVADDGQPHICGGHQENHCHHYGQEPARRETRDERPARERVRETRERIEVRRDPDAVVPFIPAEVRRDDREAVVEERLPLCENGDGKRVSKSWHRVCDDCHFSGNRRGTTATRPTAPAAPATVRLTPVRPVTTAPAPVATRAAVVAPARPAAPAAQVRPTAVLPTPAAQTATGAEGLPELTI